MDLIKGLIGGGFGLAYTIAGPVTYIINVVDTWHSRSSVFIKLLMNLTLDAILAAIWPITWVIWIVQSAAGQISVPARVFGWH